MDIGEELQDDAVGCRLIKVNPAFYVVRLQYKCIDHFEK